MGVALYLSQDGLFKFFHGLSPSRNYDNWGYPWPWMKCCMTCFVPPRGSLPPWCWRELRWSDPKQDDSQRGFHPRSFTIHENTSMFSGCWFILNLYIYLTIYLSLFLFYSILFHSLLLSIYLSVDLSTYLPIYSIYPSTDILKCITLWLFNIAMV